ncbi:MAG: hypothetical protein ABI723_10765 [Bacteroidia bacterium]
MNKKTLIAALAGGITGFILGFLIFGLLLSNYYTTHCTTYPGLIKDSPVIWCYAVGNLLWAWMFAYVFSNWANVTTFVRGATAAIIIAAPVVIAYEFFFYAGMNLMGARVLAVDAIANIAMNAIVGGVVGTVLGMGEKKAG